MKQTQRAKGKEGWKDKVMHDQFVKDKFMHGQFVKDTEDFTSKDSWQSLKRGSLRRQTGNLVTAAQDQSPATNYRKAKVEHSRVSPRRMVCGVRS